VKSASVCDTLPGFLGKASIDEFGGSMDQRARAVRYRGAAGFLLGAAVGLAGPALAAEPAGKAPPVAVPVSIQDLMRASIEVPADGIWAAQGAERLSDDDWLLADEDTVSLTALKLRAAAKAKDSAKFSAAADHLSEVCQSCHTKYRPVAPSDGVARYPFYPKRELAK
jgi:hypothetical protein